MKKTIQLLLFVSILAGMTPAQSLAQNIEKMQWFNEPKKWEIENNSLVMEVTPKTDYWRVTHYGFTVDDAPFYYGTYGGEFEVKVKITGEYKTTFDQMGLMLRIDENNWIKTGVEFVTEKQNISTVVTHNTSDWSVIELSDAPKSVWIKAVRRLDAVEIYYSLDNKVYTMMRTCYLEKNKTVKVGLMGASPDGEGFTALFEHFTVTHLPDLKRLEWAKRNK